LRLEQTQPTDFRLRESGIERSVKERVFVPVASSRAAGESFLRSTIPALPAHGKTCRPLDSPRLHRTRRPVCISNRRSSSQPPNPKCTRRSFAKDSFRRCEFPSVCVHSAGHKLQSARQIASRLLFVPAARTHPMRSRKASSEAPSGFTCKSSPPNPCCIVEKITYLQPTRELAAR